MTANPNPFNGEELGHGGVRSRRSTYDQKPEMSAEAITRAQGFFASLFCEHLQARRRENDLYDSINFGQMCATWLVTPAFLKAADCEAVEKGASAWATGPGSVAGRRSRRWQSLRSQAIRAIGQQMINSREKPAAAGMTASHHLHGAVLIRAV